MATDRWTIRTMSSIDKSLVILLGPTGVGKTELSLRVAEHFGSPIISSDSRQLYKELPIPFEPHHKLHELILWCLGLALEEQCFLLRLRVVLGNAKNFCDIRSVRIATRWENR